MAMNVILTNQVNNNQYQFDMPKNLELLHLVRSYSTCYSHFDFIVLSPKNIFENIDFLSALGATLCLDSS
jgi:hypothetical protein